MSHTLTDLQNNQVNRINFMLEMGLTLSIFLSSFLILTIEKDWWGGYLTQERGEKPHESPAKEHKKLEKTKVPNPAYIYENTIRLIIIGSSISFFLVMAFVDCIQTFSNMISIAFNRISYCLRKVYQCISKLFNKANGEATIEYKSDR